MQITVESWNWRWRKLHKGVFVFILAFFFLQVLNGNYIAELKSYIFWVSLSFFRYAVVTGANKGIGLEIVRQLASTGIKVVLTARNEERGLQALETLKASALSHLVLFHQLDVADAATVASLADFIKSKFGKLDILVKKLDFDLSSLFLF